MPITCKSGWTGSVFTTVCGFANSNWTALKAAGSRASGQLRLVPLGCTASLALPPMAGNSVGLCKPCPSSVPAWAPSATHHGL